MDRGGTVRPLSDPLANIVWRALSGAQAGIASGTDTARRYARGYSPILAFAEPAQPDFAALEPFVEPGEAMYCADWRGALPPGWSLRAEAMMWCMVWAGATPAADDRLDAQLLDPSHAEAAVELAALTKPGPFGPRTVEMGEYLGVFDGGRLVAMAGERMHMGSWREISGVCTHPSHQGRGLARRLMNRLIRRELQRGETPFLHVVSHNEGARGLYQRMGFADHREMVVRVVARDPPATSAS